MNTPQSAAFEQWQNELIRVVDTKFSNLESRMQKRFMDDAADIARMRDESDDVAVRMRKRFELMAESQGRGDTRALGPFRDLRQAALFGKMISGFVERGHVNQADMEEFKRASLTPGTGPGGGLLMANSVVGTIISNLERYGVADRNINVIDLDSESTGVPRISQGAQVFYPDEGVATTEGPPKVVRTQIRPTRHSVLVYMDRWMLRQYAALAVFIVDEMSRALAEANDKNVFVGDGTPAYARYVGVFNRAEAANTIITAVAGDNTFDEVIEKNVLYLRKVAGSIPESTELFEPKWYMHRTNWFGYLGVRDSNGKPVADFYAGGKRMIWGYDVDVTQVAPKNTGSDEAGKVMLAFGALRRGWVGVRYTSGIELRTSDDYKFAEGLTAILLDCVQRYEEVDPSVMVLLKTNAS